MTAINRGTKIGRIVSRNEKLDPKGFVYRILFGDNTTTTVEERSNISRNINDEYVIQMYDDPFYNTFLKRI